MPIERKLIKQGENPIADYYGSQALFDPRNLLTSVRAAEFMASAEGMGREDLLRTIEMMLLTTHGLQRRFQRASRINEMSDLPNKTALKETLQSVIYGLQRMEREGIASPRRAFGFGDLDGLKTINDNLDHVAGDHAIKSFAKALRQHVRDDEYVSHMSGDEFGIILTDTTNNPDFMHEAKERLETDISDATFDWDGNVYPLKGSFGFVEIMSTDTPESVIARADEHMQILKKAKGHDRYRGLPEPVGVVGTEDAAPAL